MLSLHSKPILRDMYQESRIAFARQFIGKTQHDIATELGIRGKCKRRIMTRYEKGNRNFNYKIKPKDTNIEEDIHNNEYDVKVHYDKNT